jgi:hypothetical protein
MVRLTKITINIRRPANDRVPADRNVHQHFRIGTKFFIQSELGRFVLRHAFYSIVDTVERGLGHVVDIKNHVQLKKTCKQHILIDYIS